MKKGGSFYVCQGCGSHSPKWMGRCPGCGEWNTLLEESAVEAPMESAFPPSEPVLYDDVQEAAKQKVQTGIEELNRVLGGGLVLGSLVLIGGEPGIGKSTLLLQVSRDFAAGGDRVLYVSGEESLEQIKLRGSRLGIQGGELFLLAETNLERIVAHAEKLAPRIFILDSVQTVYSSQLSSSPGTISQVREVTNQVFRYSKKNEVSSFLVGHITKEGALAGPKALEHMVDVVLYFEGERDHRHRVLRALKNRFGPVSELAVFEMSRSGLEAIANPSAFFLKERPKDAAGSVVVCTLKGSRPFLAEIQALVSSTLFSGNPRRMSLGLDHFRTGMLLAVIEKQLGFGFGGDDIHLNVAGGLSIDEPAADLGVVSAVVSCIKNRPVPPGLLILGEVGLSGEVRSVSQPVTRVKEAARMGFETVVLPRGNLEHLEKEDLPGTGVHGVHHIREALGIIF